MSKELLEIANRLSVVSVNEVYEQLDTLMNVKRLVRMQNGMLDKLITSKVSHKIYKELLKEVKAANKKKSTEI